MVMDRINTNILKLLRDGHISIRTIATELGITENTVRSRIKKLEGKCILNITWLIDPEKIPNHTMAILGIKLKNTNSLISDGEKISKLKGVVSVGIVTGRFDIILIALLNDKFTLLNFMTHEISRIKNVLSTETFIVFKNYNLKAPYIL